ncbi:Subunit of the glycosylphosphatidylinositol transamidase complex-like protein [Coemansia sp. RSA 988]|nr:Subunit of the glycosylphosphatidylinositol transamidase complex-like protein [Coemansia sp. RSA 988]
MRLLRIAALVAACSAIVNATVTSLDTKGSFVEELIIKPLNDGKVLLHFEFTMHEAAAARNGSLHSYNLLPRQIGEIAWRYDLNELRLAFTQGSWRESWWGYAPTASHGVGAEILARIEGSAGASSHQWTGLANALSGVFCASLNFVGDENTDVPLMSFVSESGSNSSTLRRSYLPRENVCTENLTPWIKQLPCQSKSGIGMLLNPHRLYNMHFHSMAVSLDSATDPSGSGSRVLRYKQLLSVVLDPLAFGLRNSSWSLSELMDRRVGAACPVASRSVIQVAAPDVGLHIAPQPDSSNKVAGRLVHTFDMQKRNIDDIAFSFEPGTRSTYEITLPAIAAHRYVTGQGGSSGGVESIIVNRRAVPITVTYLDTLPWYLRVYSHTLVVNSESEGAPALVLRPSKSIFTPAIDRGRPSSMELELKLPPNSRTILRYDFDKGFLRYTEHPPDANRGFSIAPAVVSYRLTTTNSTDDQPLLCTINATQPQKSKECTVHLYTEQFLASLPTPDFSMPYNVVSISCTILALFFGRVFNLLTRDFVVLEK